jgi:hypothetical protein
MLGVMDPTLKPDELAEMMEELKGRKKVTGALRQRAGTLIPAMQMFSGRSYEERSRNDALKLAVDAFNATSKTLNDAADRQTRLSREFSAREALSVETEMQAARTERQLDPIHGRRGQLVAALEDLEREYGSSFTNWINQHQQKMSQYRGRSMERENAELVAQYRKAQLGRRRQLMGARRDLWGLPGVTGHTITRVTDPEQREQLQRQHDTLKAIADRLEKVLQTGPITVRGAGEYDTDTQSASGLPAMRRGRELQFGQPLLPPATPNNPAPPTQ